MRYILAKYQEGQTRLIWVGSRQANNIHDKFLLKSFQGEAGIGKTVLVELMSNIMEASFQIMIVHTGVSDQQVVDFVLAGIEL